MEEELQSVCDDVFNGIASNEVTVICNNIVVHTTATLILIDVV